MDENFFQFNYYILEAELGSIITELAKDMSNISIRRSLNVYKDFDDLEEEETIFKVEDTKLPKSRYFHLQPSKTEYLGRTSGD